MSVRNELVLLLQRLLSPLGLRLVKVAPNKVRGIEPLLDIKAVLSDVGSPVIFDVGANDGETAEELLTHFPGARLIAFEPFRRNCEILASKFQHHSNVRVENVALGASLGVARLNVFSGDRMNSLLEMSEAPENIMKGKFPKLGAEEVKLETLDSYCSTNAIGRIDALKIDTQGYDLNVLKGASRLLSSQRIGAVLLEINFIPMYEGQSSFVEIHEMLASVGYRLVDLYNHTRPQNAIAWCDACYVPEGRESLS